MAEMVLLNIGFLDVVVWLILAVFFMMFIFMFVSVFTDIIMRRSMSGFAKAIWILAIFIFPLIGILAYIIFRPAPTEEEMTLLLRQQSQLAGQSTSEEISRANELLKAGVINQAEFDRIKARALQ